jgi:hypothetical protein
MACTLGCVSTTSAYWPAVHLFEKEVPCQIVCTWQNTVHFVPDTTKGGKPIPGLLGRLYLFGREVGYPLLAEGTLSVDLYDETTDKPVLQERWVLDPQTMAKLTKTDMIGPGYTVFLPWSQYRESTTKVRLRAGFQTPKGAAPIYTENVVTLAETNGVIREGKPMAMPTPPRGR